MFKKTISSIVCLCFVFSNFPSVQAREFAVNDLPVPGSMVGLSESFTPLSLKGLIVNTQKPLEFQFIVDTGRGSQEGVVVQAEANRLVKYFLAGLTIPEGDLWVNLSPYEKDRITTSSLGQTELGRDLLAQDYILKQLTASLIYPEKDLGREFWKRVYKQAQEQFGTTNIPVNTFNKVWILPDEAQVFENGAAAYVTKSTLKVMLDEDYTAQQKNQANPKANISSQIVRQIVIPEITKEINEGKNFAPLRQIYQALILAKWYKETIHNGLLDAVYTNKHKTGGITLNEPAIKQQIYERYLQAYKKGVFNYIKEDGKQAPRKYFSGGITKLEPDHIARDGAMSAVYTQGRAVVLDVKLDSAMMADTHQNELIAAIRAGHFKGDTIKVRLINVKKITAYVLNSVKNILSGSLSEKNLLDKNGQPINPQLALMSVNQGSVVYSIAYTDGSFNYVFIDDISGGGTTVRAPPNPRAPKPRLPSGQAEPPPYQDGRSSSSRVLVGAGADDRAMTSLSPKWSAFSKQWPQISENTIQEWRNLGILYEDEFRHWVSDMLQNAKDSNQTEDIQKLTEFALLFQRINYKEAKKLGLTTTSLGNEDQRQLIIRATQQYPFGVGVDELLVRVMDILKKASPQTATQILKEFLVVELKQQVNDNNRSTASRGVKMLLASSVTAAVAGTLNPSGSTLSNWWGIPLAELAAMTVFLPEVVLKIPHDPKNRKTLWYSAIASMIVLPVVSPQYFSFLNQPPFMGIFFGSLLSTLGHWKDIKSYKSRRYRNGVEKIWSEVMSNSLLVEELNAMKMDNVREVIAKSNSLSADLKLIFLFNGISFSPVNVWTLMKLMREMPVHTVSVATINFLADPKKVDFIQDSLWGGAGINHHVQGSRYPADFLIVPKENDTMEITLNIFLPSQEKQEPLIKSQTLTFNRSLVDRMTIEETYNLFKRYVLVQQYLKRTDSVRITVEEIYVDFKEGRVFSLLKDKGYKEIREIMALLSDWQEEQADVWIQDALVEALQIKGPSANSADAAMTVLPDTGIPSLLNKEGSLDGTKVKKRFVVTKDSNVEEAAKLFEYLMVLYKSSQLIFKDRSGAIITHQSSLADVERFLRNNKNEPINALIEASFAAKNLPFWGKIQGAIISVLGNQNIIDLGPHYGARLILKIHDIAKFYGLVEKFSRERGVVVHINNDTQEDDKQGEQRHQQNGKRDFFVNISPHGNNSLDAQIISKDKSAAYVIFAFSRDIDKGIDVERTTELFRLLDEWRIKGDRAQISKAETPGGIDLNQIDVNRTGKTIKVEFDPAHLNELLQGGFEGFMPVIINSTPIQSPLPLLGVGPRREPALAAGREEQLAKI